MKWTEEQTIKFVQEYIKYKCLYNVKCHESRNKPLRDAALLNISKAMDIPDFGPKEAYTKIRILRSTYSQELTKIKNSTKSEAGLENMYVPNIKWFKILYEAKEGNVWECTETTSNLGSPESSGVYYDVKYVPEKKKQKMEDEEIKPFLNVCADPLFYGTDALENKNEDTDSDAFGTFISKKFSKISNAEQRMYAEALITKIANYAILNKLTEFTDVSNT